MQAQIDPANVTLQYQSVPGLPSQVSSDIWGAIIKIVVNTNALAADPALILNSSAVVQFVQSNSLNPILIALSDSTTAIVSNTTSNSQSMMRLFLILLVAVSCALLLSMGFLLPIITKAKRSKEEVLRLFLLKKVEKSIDEQLKVCRAFITRH